MTKQDSRLWILIFYALSALWAVAGVFFGEIAGIFQLANLGIALAPTMWLIGDAKQKSYFVPHIVQPFILAFWSIVLPVYVIWTRRWRGARLVLLHVVATLLINGILSYATTTVLQRLVIPAG